MKFKNNTDFSDSKALERLDKQFLDFLSLHHFPNNFRSKEFSPLHYSEFIIELSPYLNDFLADFFDINEAVEKFKISAENYQIIEECRRKFVQRIALNKYPLQQISIDNYTDFAALLEQKLGLKFTPLTFALNILSWLLDPENNQTVLEAASYYAAYRCYYAPDNYLFCLPIKINKENLLAGELIYKLQNNRLDFNFSDVELTAENAAKNVNYCLYCHHRDKDYCAKKNPYTNQSGCPLKQKISEMNYVMSRGYYIAAFAIALIDNPLIALTGHRICYECKNACIFQKQEAVDVPLIESHLLKAILELPWGVEIYFLLLKWNPLNLNSYLPKNNNNYNILIAGSGPSGIALAYYLLHHGCNVIMFEGFKVSPLTFDINHKIKHWGNYQENLAEKIPQGFGGVLEYGITPRWNKNYLLLIRIMLERHKNFKLFGGIKLGSNISADQCLSIFDHIAVCTGAEKTKFINNDGLFSENVITATEFLMALQTNGAFLKDNKLSNLSLRMPLAIIGCGLTAIDAGVEALNYYPIQVERFRVNYLNQLKYFAKHEIYNLWKEEQKKAADEYIEHAEIFCKLSNKESIRLYLINELGGVTIYAKGELVASSAYKTNPEELLRAISEGIKFVPNMNFRSINYNKYGAIKNIEFDNGRVKAKKVFIAIGIEHHKAPAKNDKISYFGDHLKEYSGSVVKALASAKDNYLKIINQIMVNFPKTSLSFGDLGTDLEGLLLSKIINIIYLNKNFIKLIIYSPLAVKNFQIGQYFKLQKFSNDPAALFKPIAIMGSFIIEDSTISLIVDLDNKPANLAVNLQKDEPISLMGPLGTPLSLKTNQIILLVAEDIGHATLVPLAKALKEKGCEIILVSYFSSQEHIFYHEEIIKYADIIIWNIANKISEYTLIKAIEKYDIQTLAIDQIIVFASNKVISMITSFKKKIFGNKGELISIINTSMQCMMGGICGQCIIKSTKAAGGYKFSCLNPWNKNNENQVEALNYPPQLPTLTHKFLEKNT